MFKHRTVSGFVVSISLICGNASADSLDDARTVDAEINAAAAQSQLKVDSIDEARLKALADISRLEDEVQDLRIFRDHLNRLVDSQQQEAQSLTEQIQGITATRQGVVPLMYRMIDGLERHLATDKPIQYQQRKSRLEKLQAMMPAADISDAEKFRRILEAYQIEIDYGKKLGVYQGPLTLADAQTIQAELLYLGRVSLVARSLDGEQFWAWNEKNSHWQTLDFSAAAEIDKAFAMATQQASPGLVSLPLSLRGSQPIDKSPSRSGVQ